MLVHRSRFVSLILVSLSAVLWSDTSAKAQIKVGAIGDSFTDEYSALGSGLKNWVDLLVASGTADFGPFANFPVSDPRNTGGAGSYTYNYAKGGATTTSALGSTNLIPFIQNNNSQTGSQNRPDLWPGIRGAGTSGQIQYASQAIGGNDMLGEIINSQRLLLGLDTGVMNPIINRFNQITSIATAGYTSPLKMVLVKYPDLGSMPLLAGFPQFSKDSVRLNMQYFNANVDIQAATRGYATVDLFQLWDNIRMAGGINIHGIHIHPGVSSGGLQDLNSVWISDGLHPTPIFHALWANEFVRAVNSTYGTSLSELTPKAMVTLTGLDPQQAPIAVAGNEYTIQIGQSLNLDAQGSTDPNPGDIPYLTYSWDITGNDVFDDASGFSPTLTWNELVALGIQPNQVYQVRVRVDDTFGGVTTSAPVWFSVVPEPSSLILVVAGCIVGWLSRLRVTDDYHFKTNLQ
ncbi:MAG: PEP-CTERM sorting domain-containing protein [Pirellulaceae bacterium]|nr:PEP-CTERM sorting domain-containing protein [Pirellulaceae bacterium]